MATLETDRNKKILLELVKRPDNSTCADCGALEPDWACSKLGVFVCLKCSGAHRNLPAGRIKSIRLDFWEDDLVEFMKSKGNALAKALYEKVVPLYYYRPQPDDFAVLREQWIRAKYERMEFNGHTKYPPLGYTTGCLEGILWKKKKDSGQFIKRRFALSEPDFTLDYYNKDDTQENRDPKGRIPIKELNVTFQPQKIGHAHGLQLSFPEENHTRNIYVYHKSGEEIVVWFNAIRAARFAYLKTAYPTGSDKELLPKIARAYLKEGFMEKTGPTLKEAFKKRWFLLDGYERKLYYFKGQLDAREQGAVFIGTESNGYSVSDSVPTEIKKSNWKCGLTLSTPDRQFVFMCEQKEDQREWVDALKQVIGKPMQPQEYTTEANLRSAKN